MISAYTIIRVRPNMRFPARNLGQDPKLRSTGPGIPPAGESGCHIATSRHTDFGSLTRFVPDFMVFMKKCVNSELAGMEPFVRSPVGKGTDPGYGLQES